MIPIRAAIADLKKAIATAKGAETRLLQCSSTPTHRRQLVEFRRIIGDLEEELRGLKYVAEQERLSQQRQAALQ